MKAVIQRVARASVTVDGRVIGKIEKGLAVLLGVCQEDTEGSCDLLAQKTADLRIFTDETDKMNLSLLDVGGEALVVSNFTLCADTKKGNRPSFTGAMEPDAARALYLRFADALRKKGIKAETGEFGADMKLELLNDGPVTILLDTGLWEKHSR